MAASTQAPLGKVHRPLLARVVDTLLSLTGGSAGRLGMMHPATFHETDLIDACLVLSRGPTAGECLSSSPEREDCQRQASPLSCSAHINSISDASSHSFVHLTLALPTTSTSSATSRRSHPLPTLVLDHPPTCFCRPPLIFVDDEPRHQAHERWKTVLDEAYPPASTSPHSPPSLLPTLSTMSTFYVPSSESTTLSAIAPSVSRDSANSAPTMHWDLAHFLTTPPMSAPASFCSFPQHDLQIRPSTDAGLVDSQPFDFSHLAQASPHNSSALPSTSHLPSPASLPPPSPLSRSLSSQSATPATLSELAAILKAPRPKSPRKPTIKKEKRASKARAITTKHPPLRNEMPSVLVPMDVKPTSVLEVPKLEVVVPEPLFRAASPEAVEMPHTPPSSATSPIASTLVASPVSASFAPLGDWTTFSLPPTPTVEAGLPLIVALMTADEEERKPKRPKKMPEGYIKRPSNAWMIYRSARVKEFAERQKNGGSVVPPQSDLSKVIAELWRSETLDVREAYARLALAEAEEHQKRYPEYTFKPAKVARKVAPKRVVDESAASAPSTSSSSTAPSKRVRRPALKKSHTVSGGESYQELLPAFELPTPLSHYYPSSSYTSASDSNSYTDPSAFVDITLGLGSLLTPPTPAVTEAWSSFAASTAPTPSSSSSSWFDVLSGISSSLQLDISSSCFPIPASAPANLTSFDFTFDLPSPPLAGVAAVVALPSPPVDESMQPSGSVYDEIVAMLARAPEPSTAPLPSPAGLVFVPPPSANTSIHSSRSRIDLDTFLREIGSATSSSS